jgi:hypothetical protein
VASTPLPGKSTSTIQTTAAVLLPCAQSDALRISISTVAPMQLPNTVYIRMQEWAISVRACVRARARVCVCVSACACALANSLCYVLAWLALQLTGLYRQLAGQYRRLLGWCRQSIGLHRQLTGLYRNSYTTYPKQWTQDWVRAERLELSRDISAKMVITVGDGLLTKWLD